MQAIIFAALTAAPRPSWASGKRGAMHGRAFRTPALMKYAAIILLPTREGRPAPAGYAKAFEPVRDGRIYIEKINGPFLSPVEYAVGLDRAISLGWLQLHESATFVKQRGAAPTCCLKAAEDWMALARSADGGVQLGGSWQNSHRRNRRSQGQLMQAPVTQLVRLNAGPSLTPRGWGRFIAGRIPA